jgi:hypothetical protein
MGALGTLRATPAAGPQPRGPDGAQHEERDDPEANAERPAGWLQLSLAGGVFAKLNADGEESEERDQADSRFGHRARG